MLNQSQIEQIINEFKDPSSQMTLGESKARVNIKLEGDKLNVALTLGYPAKGYVDSLQAELKALLAEQTGLTDISLTIDWKITKHKVQQGVQAINNIKNIIAVASGKGGVGKSTTSVNLALALAADGATVGILDADIYGPSQPRMLGVSNTKPESSDGTTMEPVMSLGLQSMSIGYLIDEDTPMIWRGPMVTQALEQLLNDTTWREVDFLIIDLPPGTGDTQLTLAQKVPVSGAVIVTTPQDIALLDARKAYKMFEKVEVPVLGVIENMSIHICSKCGHEEKIFGEGGGQKMSDDFDIKFLGSLPLDIQIREEADNGKPTVAADPDSRITEIYKDIARRTTAKLSQQAKDYSAKFPKIVIAND